MGLSRKRARGSERSRRHTYAAERGIPRPARIVSEGPSALSDADLLCLVAAHDGKEEQFLEKAEALLQGSPCAALARMTRRRLSLAFGTEGAARVLAALELGRRALRGSGSRALSSPRQVFDYARAYATAEREHFLVVHLNARHVPVFLEVVSIGTLDASLVHPREVFRRAIAEGSAAIVLVHNHPSGDPTPSDEDVEVTGRLVQVGEVVGIRVLDHVVIAADRYFSFREMGLLPD